MGYTRDSRPGIFARRAAPVQVNYLGYAGTLGIAAMDYIIADRIVIPETERASYAEKIVWLPDSFQVNDEARPISARTPTRAEARLPERGFVFCAFNQSYKITPAVFDVWARLLRELEGSVLWLADTNAVAARNLGMQAEQRGVSPERLIFAPRVASMEDHLARYRCADLFLDTFPFNAHSTASDALWAGLPLLTCIGGAYASRVAASLLSTLNLPQLITRSLAEYEARALELARDATALHDLKAELALNVKRSALFDTARFRRNIEAAYVEMWECCKRGKAPVEIAVDPR
jgi:predicted O-linked N-acetylglucosamine transferase (SPINDLY family)